MRYTTVTGGPVTRTTSAPAATAAAAIAVGIGPKRVPAQAVMTEPATAPRLRARAKVRAEPRL